MLTARNRPPVVISLKSVGRSLTHLVQWLIFRFSMDKGP